MKIVNVIGGLGNQMFQYAFAMALDAETDEKVLIDTSHFKGYGLHNGFEIFERFGEGPVKKASFRNLIKVTNAVPNYFVSRCLRRLLPKRRTEYIEPRDFAFDPEAQSRCGNIYFEGYWQSEKYFSKIKKSLIDYFHFEISDEVNSRLIEDLHAVNSVGIHVRRGDYIGASLYHDICTTDYYHKGIEYICQKVIAPEFYVFSDDIDWCRENLASAFANRPVSFISHNTGAESYKDMALMTHCQHLIIANSSFSWWGAYLNSRCGIIVASKRWVHKPYDVDTPCADWHLYDIATHSISHVTV